MRAHLLTRYGIEGSDSRYRIFHFLPYLQSTGFDYIVSPFFGDNYYLTYRLTNYQAMLPRLISFYAQVASTQGHSET